MASLLESHIRETIFLTDKKTPNGQPKFWQHLVSEVQ